MRNNIKLVIVYILITILFVLLIFLKFSFSSFIPIIYLLTFYPIFIIKWLKLSTKFSLYLKKNHTEFYNINKSITYSLSDANLVLNVNEEDIKKLDDFLVMEYVQEIKGLRKLMFSCILGFIILAIILIQTK